LPVTKINTLNFLKGMKMKQVFIEFVIAGMLIRLYDSAINITLHVTENSVL